MNSDIRSQFLSIESTGIAVSFSHRQNACKFQRLIDQESTMQYNANSYQEVIGENTARSGKLTFYTSSKTKSALARPVNWFKIKQ